MCAGHVEGADKRSASRAAETALRSGGVDENRCANADKRRSHWRWMVAIYVEGGSEARARRKVDSDAFIMVARVRRGHHPHHPIRTLPHPEHTVTHQDAFKFKLKLNLNFKLKWYTSSSFWMCSKWLPVWQTSVATFAHSSMKKKIRSPQKL